jgi:hypothetical protein
MGSDLIIVSPEHADNCEQEALSLVRLWRGSVGECAGCVRDMALIREVVEKVGFGIVGRPEAQWVFARHLDENVKGHDRGVWKRR